MAKILYIHFITIQSNLLSVFRNAQHHFAINNQEYKYLFAYNIKRTMPSFYKTPNLTKQTIQLPRSKIANFVNIKLTSLSTKVHIYSRPSRKMVKRSSFFPKPGQLEKIAPTLSMEGERLMLQKSGFKNDNQWDSHLVNFVLSTPIDQLILMPHIALSHHLSRTSGSIYIMTESTSGSLLYLL